MDRIHLLAIKKTGEEITSVDIDFLVHILPFSDKEGVNQLTNSKNFKKVEIEFFTKAIDLSEGIYRNLRTRTSEQIRDILLRIEANFNSAFDEENKANKNEIFEFLDNTENIEGVLYHCQWG